MVGKRGRRGSRGQDGSEVCFTKAKQRNMGSMGLFSPGEEVLKTEVKFELQTQSSSLFFRPF